MCNEKKYQFYKLEDGFMLEQNSRDGETRLVKDSKLIFIMPYKYTYTDLGDNILFTSSVVLSGKTSPARCYYRIIGYNSKPESVWQTCPMYHSIDSALNGYTEKGLRAKEYELEALQKGKLEPVIGYPDLTAKQKGILIEWIDGCTYVGCFS